jgi:uncharacterized protein affecting Mg2+/Co2+ transport
MQEDQLLEDMVLKAQLRSRHWRGFTTGWEGQRVETFRVDGDAVVGCFPIVRPGIRCNYTSASQGAFGDSLEGWFTFVPGTIECPEGPDFEVACPVLTWHDPGLMY